MTLNLNGLPEILSSVLGAFAILVRLFVLRVISFPLVASSTSLILFAHLIERFVDPVLLRLWVFNGSLRFRYRVNVIDKVVINISKIDICRVFQLKINFVLINHN